MQVFSLTKNPAVSTICPCQVMCRVSLNRLVHPRITRTYCSSIFLTVVNYPHITVDSVKDAATKKISYPRLDGRWMSKPWLNADLFAWLNLLRLPTIRGVIPQGYEQRIPASVAEEEESKRNDVPVEDCEERTRHKLREIDTRRIGSSYHLIRDQAISIARMEILT